MKCSGTQSDSEIVDVFVNQVLLIKQQNNEAVRLEEE